MIDPLFEGFNGCIFAYGATGTGKTYTMLGNEENPGLITFCLNDIFDWKNIFSDQYEIKIKVSYVEVYNEYIRDLLTPKENKFSCSLWDDPIKGVKIAGVSKIEVTETSSIMKLLLVGNQRRTTESTNANEFSSRSHAIFQIKISLIPKIKNIYV